MVSRANLPNSNTKRARNKNPAKNCYNLTLPTVSQGEQSTGLNQILTLVERSDTTAVKSEGTRVFVNVIRTLWQEDTHDARHRGAMAAVSVPPVALALAQLVGRSKKYPILINEGIVALTLLSIEFGAFSSSLSPAIAHNIARI
jgi:hypothetical protein